MSTMSVGQTERHLLTKRTRITLELNRTTVSLFERLRLYWFWTVDVFLYFFTFTLIEITLPCRFLHREQTPRNSCICEPSQDQPRLYYSALLRHNKLAYLVRFWHISLDFSGSDITSQLFVFRAKGSFSKLLCCSNSKNTFYWWYVC